MFITIGVLLSGVILFLTHGYFYKKVHTYAHTSRSLRHQLTEISHDPYLGLTYVDSISTTCLELFFYTQHVKHHSRNLYRLAWDGSKLVRDSQELYVCACSDIESRTSAHAEYIRLYPLVLKAFSTCSAEEQVALGVVQQEMGNAALEIRGQGIFNALHELQAMYRKHA